jgi:exopolysaccharide biosynthesis polyprenyl glycosylphosphotransferase
MSGPRRILLQQAFKLIDILIMCLSFFLAAIVAFYEIGDISLSNFLSMRIKLQNFIGFACFLYAWSLLFHLFLLYHSRRFLGLRDELADIVKATTCGTLTLAIATALFRIALITPNFLIVFWIVSTILTCTSRLVIRRMLNLLRRQGRNVRSILVVGTNSRAVRFAKTVESKPELGYQILGFVDDWWTGMEEFTRMNYPFRGHLSHIPELLRTTVVDEVVISLPMKSSYDQISHIVGLCEEQGIVVWVLSDIFDSRLTRKKSWRFEEDDMITIYSGAIDFWPSMVKRLIDFILAVVLLVLTAPLFLICGVLIKVTSAGPVLFVQERVGLNKRRFRLYKFRTMVDMAENKLADLEHLNEVSGPVFKIKDDPRITSIGKFLRKMSLDELPQLVNVLKGDMSMVGPRPLPVRDYNGFSKDWQRRRFSVPPGITCLWQINGRSNIDFEKWMQLDMEYIDNWSLWLDMKILSKTIPAVLRRRGAV